MGNNRENRILIALDFEVEPPIPVYARLLEIFGRLVLLELLGKRLTDRGRKPGVVLFGSLRETDSHRCFGLGFAVRDSKAAIASCAEA